MNKVTLSKLFLNKVDKEKEQTYNHWCIPKEKQNILWTCRGSSKVLTTSFCSPSVETLVYQAGDPSQSGGQMTRAKRRVRIWFMVRGVRGRRSKILQKVSDNVRVLQKCTYTLTSYIKYIIKIVPLPEGPLKM